MGIDLEMFFNIKRNEGKKWDILEDIMKQRGIVTYKIKGSVFDIERPEPTVDYDALPPEESHAAFLKDCNRPESMAVFCYGIFSFTVGKKFIYASIKDRWNSFFDHRPNRQHDLEYAIEVARQFTDRFYLVPDESCYHYFSSSRITQEDFTAVFKHPELLVVHMPPNVMKLSLEDAAKNVSYRTNNLFLKSKIKQF